jgi:hypothetical protein
MFNAFNEINKSENIINKFTQSVNAFTTACKNLMNAMGINTEAINNIDFAGVHDQNERIIKNNIINMSSTDTANQNCSVHITNVEELAKTIAENIHGALAIEIPDTQVQLLINGTSGNEWTITKY